jgi:ABC-type amino acid transport substrate-binding protein
MSRFSHSIRRGRAKVDFSRAYLEAHNAYLVPAGSAIRTLDDVDRPASASASVSATPSIFISPAP